MKVLNILIIVLGLILSIEAQRTSRGEYYTDKRDLNTERIYFIDNKPRINVNSQKDIKNISEVNGLPINDNRLLGQVKSVSSDSYLEAVNANTANKQNASIGQEHISQDLQPPIYQGNRQNHYDFADNRHLLNESTGQNANRIKNQVTNTQINHVSTAVTNFGLNLVKNIIETQEGNFVVSPLSIATLLALLQQGALGTTQEQISTALQLSPEVAASAFKRLTDEVQKRGSLRNILRTANSVFVADAFDLNPEFKRNAIRNFGSNVQAISFARPDEAANRINLWVATKTQNKIQTLVTPETTNENSQLVLVNAVYFKGLWETMFRADSTLPRDFYLSNGATKTAPFMRMRRIFKSDYDQTTNSQVIILPFEREQYSLLVILPSEGTSVAAVLSTLTTSRLAEYHNFLPKEVELELPRFTVRADTDLNLIFQKMGISKIFGSQSELSGLGNYRTLSPQVTSALHSAVLSIDEQGGSAAAATAFAVVALSYDDPSTVFRANRPFAAILWDNSLTLPLFIAVIEDPTS